MNDNLFTLIVLHELPLLLHAGFLKGAPLLWAALGGAYSERSGVINIGLEGMMLIGAFAAVVGSGLSGNPWVGLLLGAFSGGLAGLIHAWISLHFKADQIVSGMGINLVALGITGFLLYRVFHARGNSPEVAKLPALQAVDWMPEGLSRLLFPLSVNHVLLVLAVGLTMVVFYRTRFGLRLRACGESVHVVQSAGIRVAIYRYTAVILSGILAGLGGVQLAICDVSHFSTGMSNGRGFVALAILICSGWRPGRAVLICLLFGVADALAERMQSVFVDLPSRILLAVPFILALGVLAARKQLSRPPQALGKT